MGTNGKSLEDRMKAYEAAARFMLTPRTPVLIRVDGRAFHSYTAKMERPFDAAFQEAMLHAAIHLAHEIQGFKVAYVQSDEASFLMTDYDTLATDGWFGYVQSKVVSIAAATMTAALNQEMRGRFPDLVPHAAFDARAFNMPREDVSNYFLWRARDWKRNSLHMYARAFFSHNELYGKDGPALHELLHTKGKNWATDLTDHQKNGTFIVWQGNDCGLTIVDTIVPAYAEVSAMIEPLLLAQDETVGWG